MQVTAAPMMHSMDFHSAMVSPQDKYRSIAPGPDDRRSSSPLNYPGVFMYHCGTPMVLEHIASGHVRHDDRRAARRLSDQGRSRIRHRAERVLHASSTRSKRKVDGQPLYVLDGDRVRAKAPTYTVFNGRYNGMVDKPLPAKPGERVRLFVLNVGPSNTSSFHVVGTIFDRVWIEGNPDNQFRGMQTVLLGSSNGAIVEFVIPEAGNYIMVDHHFANASQGAIGLIAASGKPGIEAGDREHHNIPATAAPTDPLAVKGKLAFESKCLACHSIAGGDKLGPDLLRRDQATRRGMAAQVAQESGVDAAASDPAAKEMLAKYKVPMPNQNLSDEEIKQYLEYFKWADTNLRPQGKRSRSPRRPAPRAVRRTHSPPLRCRRPRAPSRDREHIAIAVASLPSFPPGPGLRCLRRRQVAATYDHAAVPARPGGPGHGVLRRAWSARRPTAQGRGEADDRHRRRQLANVDESQRSRSPSTTIASHRKAP